MSNYTDPQGKYLSDLLKGYESFRDESMVNSVFFTVQVNVDGADELVDVIGTPAVWDDTSTRYEKYVDQDIGAIAGTGLPAGMPKAILTVGTALGVGFKQPEQQTIGNATTVKFQAMKSPLEKVAIVLEGISWDAGSDQGDQDAFEAELKTQGYTVVPTATDANTAYIQ